MIVYLGGPINGCTDEEANGWRDAAKKVLAERGLKWIDPMDRDYRGREMEPGIAKIIVWGDKHDIAKSDLLLMNCPKPSYGTAMEIFYGHSIHKQVIAVIPEGAIPSPWVLEHAHVFRGSVVDAIKIWFPL